MGIKALYRAPVESARHEQIRLLVQEYFTQHQKLMDRPSRRYAERARRALIKLKKVSHQRGLELLDLYSPYRNQGKPIITVPQKQNQPRKKNNVS